MKPIQSSQRPTLPTCPVCGGRHYPATTGKGNAVWCHGIPVAVKVPDFLPESL